jgi:SAM-dependent methyltransferase
MRLINGTSNRKDKLIDFAVGKAGDLSKWRNANIGFVFGVDVSKDNIMNRENGACARYLSESSKYANMPDALFIHGNSAKNIRSGDAFDGHKEKTIAHAVFGEGPKSRADLGANVYKAYGIAQEGFNISSCQFALHYFFENVRTMHNFVRNVAECTRVGGIFVGTCWDGKNIFNLLRNKPCGDAFSISRFGTRVFQITKMYDYTAFPDDELSLGYSISVFQESIGQHIVEYLVNFDFFQRVMENYGFVLMNREEATQFGFPNGGTGMFDGLYYDMMASISREQTNRYGTAPDMTEDEKFISFLNRYFIFRKVRHVAAEKITKIIEQKMPSKEASKCANAAERIAPVAYESMSPLYRPPNRGDDSLEEGEEGEEEESIHKIAKTFSTREQIAEKERMEEERNTQKKEPYALAKSTQDKSTEEQKPTEPLHFIRTLGNTKVTIRTYEPLDESSNKGAKEPMEITNLPIEETEPAIRLLPKTVRVGKTIRVPKPKK